MRRDLAAGSRALIASSSAAMFLKNIIAIVFISAPPVSANG
jgi:hypothetical protein